MPKALQARIGQLFAARRKFLQVREGELSNTCPLPARTRYRETQATHTVQKLERTVGDLRAAQIEALEMRQIFHYGDFLIADEFRVAEVEIGQIRSGVGP